MVHLPERAKDALDDQEGRAVSLPLTSLPGRAVRRWRERHGEAALKKMRDWARGRYKRNREKILQKQCERRRDNDFNAKQRAYRKRTKDASNKAWRANNRDAILSSRRRLRRARGIQPRSHGSQPPSVESQRKEYSRQQKYWARHRSRRREIGRTHARKARTLTYQIDAILKQIAQMEVEIKLRSKGTK